MMVVAVEEIEWAEHLLLTFRPLTEVTSHQVSGHRGDSADIGGCDGGSGDGDSGDIGGCDGGSGDGDSADIGL